MQFLFLGYCWGGNFPLSVRYLDLLGRGVKWKTAGSLKTHSTRKSSCVNARGIPACKRAQDADPTPRLDWPDPPLDSDLTPLAGLRPDPPPAGLRPDPPWLDSDLTPPPPAGLRPTPPSWTDPPPPRWTQTWPPPGWTQAWTPPPPHKCGQTENITFPILRMRAVNIGRFDSHSTFFRQSSQKVSIHLKTERLNQNPHQWTAVRSTSRPSVGGMQPFKVFIFNDSYLGR